MLLLEVKSVQSTSPSIFEWCSYQNCRWILIQMKRTAWTLAIVDRKEQKRVSLRLVPSNLRHTFCQRIVSYYNARLQRSSFLLSIHDTTTLRQAIYGKGRTKSLHYTERNIISISMLVMIGRSFSSFLASPKQF